MPWIRVDDAFNEHPKIARLGDSALALWFSGLAYCNRNLTDGFIPTQVGIGQLRFCDGRASEAIGELVDVGLWVRVERGWQIHDYLEYQRSAAQIIAERERTARRQGDFRKRKKSNAVNNAVTNAVSNGGGNAGPQPQPHKDQERLSDTSDVDLVFAYWLSARNKSARYKLTPDRAAKIRARLRQYTVEQLKRAIDGVALDPWDRRGENDDCGLIFRDAQHVDRFLSFAEPKNGNGPMMASNQKTWRPS